MVTMSQRPTLSAEEQAALLAHASTIATARSVLDDLEAIGLDVSPHRDLLERTEAQRAGLLQRFTSTQYVPPPSSRARK